MTELRFEKKIIPAQEMNGESTLPALSEIGKFGGYPATDLDEDDNFWAGFGEVASPFPYRMQNMYTRELHDTEFLASVLENDYLKATFLPDYGGKLWSLYDKVKGKDLLLENPVVRPCNLAIRNAWTSGGVEWNCGFLGHHPYTCERLYTAQTKLADGTPVLRMYQYERVREVVYQMDFFLPENSRLLYCRMRVVNDKPYSVPIYWWSNIAVPEEKGARVIAPVDECYTYIDGVIRKTPVPHPAKWDCDITYPTNLTHSVDFFWKIPAPERKFICQLDRDGYGLIQCSTSRLQGRKLFVWGQGPGGKRWQNYLSADDFKGGYAEIQCGLAQSQYESIPMPPRSAWEWLEGYGAMTADVDKVHGEWQGAKAEVKDQLDAIVSVEELDRILKETKEMALSPAEKTVLYGKSWAALENLRRAKCGEKTLCAHLDFGTPDEDMADWAALLENGSYAAHTSDDEVKSWMLSEEWDGYMEKAAAGGDWYALLQLGMTQLAKRNFARAKILLTESAAKQASALAYYGLAQLARIDGDKNTQKNCILSAYKLKKDDLALTKEAMSELFSLGEYGEVVKIYEGLNDEFASVPRVKLSAAYSYFRNGDIDTAEKMLFGKVSLLVPDIREGEESVTSLYLDIAQARAKAKGEEIDRKDVKIPAELDFRMFAEE